MKEIGKGMVLAGAAVLIVWIHWNKKKRADLNWRQYGEKLLGIQAAPAGRKRYLDELRLLAAVLVILVHSMQSAASQILAAGMTAERTGMGLWYVLTGAAGLGLCCNLLFVMISGALLLPDREEAAGVFYRKRAAKVVIPLIAYYLFYLRRSGLVSFSLTSAGAALRMILSGPMELVPHFWLIYVLIGLYIGVPFLRRMLGQMPDELLGTMAAVILLGAAVKTGFYFLGIGFGINTFLFSWEGIFLLGYVMTRECCRRYDRAVWLSGILAAVLIVWIGCTREDAAAAAANDSVFMVLFSMAVFLLFLRRDEGRTGQAASGRSMADSSAAGRVRAVQAGGRIIQMVSRYSYSILLIHWFMLFVVVEKHLHIGPMMFGGEWILAGVLIQSAAALLFSLFFAVVFDQTVVLLGEWCWEEAAAAVWNICKICRLLLLKMAAKP